MKKHEWKPTADGLALVESYEYAQADQMPTTEETVLGGVVINPPHHLGYVIRNNERVLLISRFTIQVAKRDVTARLEALGHEMIFETPTKAEA